MKILFRIGLTHKNFLQMDSISSKMAIGILVVVIKYKGIAYIQFGLELLFQQWRVYQHARTPVYYVFLPANLQSPPSSISYL